jgi:hypothetical protein
VTRRTADDGEQPEEDTQPAGRDPDSMSAPDQLEVQQLHTARAEAEARGDEAAVETIDARLRVLLNP